MLSFFKRYQKIFFIFTAFFVGISIVFLGLLPKNLSRSIDGVAFKTRTGKKIKKSHFEGLKALLTTNNGEQLLYGQTVGMPFFAFDAFASKVAKPKILNLIAEKKQDELKGLWQEQFEREKKFKGYAHPEVHTLNADHIWARHAPKLRSTLHDMKNYQDIHQVFEARADLYLKEQEFPPFALWQFLQQQQESSQWLSIDEGLNLQSLSLFGYRTPADWFGDKMMSYVCELIFEMSDYAASHGYQVSLKEAEDDLMRMNRHHFQQLQFLGLKEFPNEEGYFFAKLERLGMNKMQIISLWREVLTFNHYLNEAAQLALIDDQTFKQFEGYALDQASVCRYSPPKELIFNSLQDVALFEAYLEVLGKPRGQVSLEFEQKKLEKIEDQFPQLVKEPVEVRYKEVSIQKVALGVSVQDVWKWKMDRRNLMTLKGKFPKLEIDDKLSDVHYQRALEDIDYFTGMQIDQFVRQLLLQENTDWKEAAFLKEEERMAELNARKNGAYFPFKGLETSSKKALFLTQFFKKAHQNNEQEPLEVTTFDDVHYYQILAVKSLGKPDLVPYSELLKDKTAHKLLRSTLLKTYAQNDDVKELQAKMWDKYLNKYLEPLKKALKQGAKQSFVQGDAFYCQERLREPMHMAYLHYKNNDGETVCLANNPSWAVLSQKESLIRHKNDSNELDQILSLQEGEWLQVTGQQKVPEFIQLLSKEKVVQERLMQNRLKAELKKELIYNLVDEHLKEISFTPITGNEFE